MCQSCRVNNVTCQMSNVKDMQNDERHKCHNKYIIWVTLGSLLPIQMDSACEILKGVWVKKGLASDWSKWVYQEKCNGRIWFYYPEPPPRTGWIKLFQTKGGPVFFQSPHGSTHALPLPVPPRRFMHETMPMWAPHFFATLDMWTQIMWGTNSDGTERSAVNLDDPD